MEDYEVVEMYEEVWPKLPKREAYLRKSRKDQVVGIAYESPDGMWICQEVRIGIRGGLSEHLVVIDPEEKVTSNRLVCAIQATGMASGNGIFIPLSKLRGKCFQEDSGVRVLIVALEIKSQYDEHHLYDRRWWKTMVGGNIDGEPLFPTPAPFPFVVTLVSGNYGSSTRR